MMERMEPEAAGPKPLLKPLLIWDGDCSFCRYSVDYAKSVTGDAVAYEPYQQAAARFPQIPAAHFRAAAQFVAPDGAISSGAAAIFATLAYAPGWRWLLWLYTHIASFAAITEWGYAWIARHRNFMFHLTRLLWGKHLERGRYELVRTAFVRAMGVIYLIAFLSWWRQIPGLIGTRGILPATGFLKDVADQVGVRGYWLVPTLAWLHPTDGFISGLAAAGVLLSLLVILGIWPGPVLALLWMLYLSQVSIGQEFMSFQWDGLLLEAGFLAIFFAPWKLFRGQPARRASRTILWLLRWLQFRLIFSSGIVKILSGDPTWRNLTALDYHYYTQPVPNPVAWYMQQLPPWFQAFSVVVMFAVELGAPFLIFAPRRLRLAGAFAIGSLELLILLTGNFAYFNLLALALLIPLLDDAYLSSVFPKTWRIRIQAQFEPPARVKHSGRIRRMALAVFAILIVWASTETMFERFGYPLPGADAAALRPMESFRIVSAYGLFAEMTTQRAEIVIEGSDDGKTWKPYEFPYKPGDLSRRPPWVAPYQPRLDWQMWFAALGNYRQNPWFINLMIRLLEGSPDVLALFEKNPFPDHPPRALRASLYDYHFTTWVERRATGHWWKRTELGEYLPAITLRQ
jgi:predicted DCC family thiol-disulfide oxidoreductase YuxK